MWFIFISAVFYVGAIPDRILTCSCHPKAGIEVKFPYSISHLSPDDPKVKLDYLKIVDGKFVLNRKHKYYTQCQKQMTVTILFFVYTSHGFILEEIIFDEEF